MRILFIASLHHPRVLEETRRRASGGEDPLFPTSQAQYFWVKALRKLGHTCAVFWRSENEIRMKEKLTVKRAGKALLERIPSLHPDFRLRNHRLTRFAAEFQPELILLIGGNNVILPETLASMKLKHGALLVYCSGTSPIVFSTRIERAAAPYYDLVITNDHYHAIQWRELGAQRCETLPLSAVDPEFHHPYQLAESERRQYGCEIGFVGTLVPQNLYSERVDALEAVKDYDPGIWSVHEVPASLRGFHRGQALGEEMLRCYSGSRIVVNPHANFMRYGGNMRLFEACGAGAFQITDDRPGVQKWFTVGEHLVTYDNLEQLRQRVRYYLDNEEERKQVAIAGQKHVYAHHTYDQRMTRLMFLLDEIRYNRIL